ncbi:hypothetical protein [Herbaspirillum sp.]|uniref:hypothetical protein n=1 Tax=Herbaspirillum sp. TaxID=1890675 RepID=UPI0031DE919C
MSDDLNRFRAHCFQFACDKLDPEEAAWMEDMLSRHPELQAEVDAERELVRLAREGLEQERKPLVSFEQIRLALEAEQARRGAADGRLAGWWRRLVSTPASNGSRWAVAAVVMLCVTAAFQARHLFERDGIPDDGYRAVEPAGPGEEGVLLVRFRDDAALGGLREQLAEMHLRIRSGPAADGTYQVVVTEGSLAQAIQRLQASSLVTEVHAMDLRGRDRP